MNLGCAFSSALIATILFACVAVAASDQEMATKFTLEDPAKKDTTISFPRPKPLILTFGDQTGSKQIESWAEPLKKEFRDSVDLIGVANLKAVPSLMRGAIRLMFKKDKGVLLLDWEGKVNKQYAAVKEKATILLIEPDGTIALRFTGIAKEESLDQIKNALNELLEDKPSS